MAFQDKKLISARIKVLYPNTNLSQQRMNEISDRLSKKLADDADETAIDQAVSDFNDYNPFAEIAKTDDKIRGLEAKKTNPTDAPADKKPIELPDDTPEWAKALLKQNEELASKVSGFEQQQSQKTLSEKFSTDERFKDIPVALVKRSIPQSADAYEQAANELLTDWTETAAALKINNVGKDNPQSGNFIAGEKGKVDPDLVKMAQSNNEAAKTKV